MIKLIVLTTLLPTSLFAGGFMPSQSDYYYQLGGSSNLFVPPINKDQTIKIGADIDGRLGFSCSGFNPVGSMKK